MTTNSRVLAAVEAAAEYNRFVEDSSIEPKLELE